LLFVDHMSCKVTDLGVIEHDQVSEREKVNVTGNQINVDGSMTCQFFLVLN